jgi:hypothetical protein
MDERFANLAAAAADRHGVFTTKMAQQFGISDRLRLEWVAMGRIERLGVHTFRFAGAPDTWKMTLASALGDLGPAAAIAGRSTAALQNLDGFGRGPVEVWTPRSYRNRATSAVTKSSGRPLLAGEKRLYQRIIDDLPANARHRQQLIDALTDSGGESALERRFLALVRRAGLPRPRLQRTYRAGTRTMARIDAEFADGLIVELAGHGTHSTRTQRQRDAQRQTELTLLNKRVITFTYDDVFGRPLWMLDVLRAAGVSAAA